VKEMKQRRGSEGEEVKERLRMRGMK